METIDHWQLILDSALAGACALVVSQLLLTGLREPWRIPLLLVFIGALWAGIASLFLELAVPTLFAVSGVAAVFMAIAALWVYTVMITTEGQIKPITHYAKHFIPVPIALALLIPVTFLPTDELALLFRTGDVDTEEKFKAVLPWLISQFVWVIWTPAYLISIWKRLSSYRIALRDIHSSTERRELIWISALVGVLGLFWFSNVLELIDLLGPDTSLPDSVTSVIDSLVIWIPALWGLRQVPGMHENNAQSEEVQATHSKEASEAQHNEKVVDTNSKQKYDHSALDEERAKRIVSKLETSMNEDQLFRDSDLSLGRLADDIGVSKHYLSQSINEILGVSFFEYINRQRTREAANLLKTSSLPAVDVAVQCGFNSRSSFYKAFKKHYSTSPANYRKSQKST